MPNLPNNYAVTGNKCAVCNTDKIHGEFLIIYMGERLAVFEFSSMIESSHDCMYNVIKVGA